MRTIQPPIASSPAARTRSAYGAGICDKNSTLSRAFEQTLTADALRDKINDAESALRACRRSTSLNRSYKPPRSS
jgi:hypothetical protein